MESIARKSLVVFGAGLRAITCSCPLHAHLEYNPTYAHQIRKHGCNAHDNDSLQDCIYISDHGAVIDTWADNYGKCSL